MKKRILLLVPTLILLTGCSKSKAPSFEKYSNAVTFDAFKAGIEEKKFADFFLFSTGCKGKVYYGVEYKSSSVIGDVYISSEEGTNEREIKFGYDMANNRSSINEKGETSYTNTGAEVDEQKVSKTTVSTQYQYNDKLDSFIYIDVKEKTYKKYTNKNVTDSILYAIDDEFVGFQSLYKQYEAETEDVKSHYAFYIDGGVFTMTFSFTNETEVVEGESTETVAKKSTKYDFLYQLEIDDGKLHFKSKCVSLIDETYLKTYSTHIKDEVDSLNTTTYCSLEIGSDTSTIKEIDISSYASLDKDPDGGLLS